MAKNLVIVESPAKAKTIKKFLGASYDVIASNGHVRDMPKSQMGIDIEHDYEPHSSQSGEKVNFWRSYERQSKKPIRYISQRTPIVREKQSHII